MSRPRLKARRVRPKLMIASAVVLAVAVVAVVAVVVIRSNRPATSISAQALQKLALTQRITRDPTYRRAAFGASWADLDSDGCNTRDEVLLATVDRSKPYTVQRTVAAEQTWSPAPGPTPTPAP